MKGWHCHWVLISFGLPPEYKLTLHEEIFTLCYYTNGGFTHSEAYNLPIYLRRFYIHKLIEYKKQEAEKHKEASGGAGKSKGPKIDRPAIKR